VPTASEGWVKKIPRGVWVLGFVSLFMDVSSEMIHALLPVFLVVTLSAHPPTEARRGDRANIQAVLRPAQRPLAQPQGWRSRAMA
jgi:hypothetical protein